MSALTAAETRSPSLWPWLLLVLLLAAAAGIAVQSRPHAVIKHGHEALAIRESCNEYGPDEVWRSTSWRDPNKFFLVCTLPDGRQGLRIIRCVKGAWRELTAFVPTGELGNGTPERVYEYVSGKAKPFTGRLVDVCK